MELLSNRHSQNKGNQSLEIYIQNIHSIGEELSVIGCKIEENNLTYTLIIGLGSQYNPFYASVNPQLNNLTFDDVVNNLKPYVSHISHQNEENVINEFPLVANNAQIYQQYDQGRGRNERIGRKREKKQLISSTMKIMP